MLNKLNENKAYFHTMMLAGQICDFKLAITEAEKGWSGVKQVNLYHFRDCTDSNTSPIQVVHCNLTHLYQGQGGPWITDDVCPGLIKVNILGAYTTQFRYFNSTEKFIDVNQDLHISLQWNSCFFRWMKPWVPHFLTEPWELGYPLSAVLIRKLRSILNF